MRWFVCALAALALGACEQAEDTQTTDANESCAHSAARDHTWAQAGAHVITTSSHGPTCGQAVVTFVMRNDDGDPVWVFASTYIALTTGETAFADAPEVSGEQMQAFLTSWGEVTEARSGALPEWRADAPALTGETFAYETPFARDAYEAMRARNAAMTCYAAGVSTTQCLVIDPATMRPTPFVRYGS